MADNNIRAAKGPGSPAFPAPAMGEPFLLTPGPLTTAAEVKQAMLCDWGSWDSDFRDLTADLRARLLVILGRGSDDYECIPLQGSGTYAVEAMLGSFAPRSGKVLVLANGSYGKRAAETMRYLERDFHLLDKGDYLPPRGDEVAAILAEDTSISHVLAIHCETSSGILNPIAEIAEATRAAGRSLLVDSMSAFGAVAIEPADIPFDAMVSSANKCIEGVPGFGFVFVRRDTLEASRGNSHSLSLDLHAQWETMEKSGQWRFTPPSHVVAAFIEALRIFEAEGGVEARGRRYSQNRDVLVSGMRELGFETLLEDAWQSPIIATFFCPGDPAFDFTRFYDLLKAAGYIIYPGKLTIADSFRIGCIGRIDDDVMRGVVGAVAHALAEMGVKQAAPPADVIEERDKLSLS